MRRGIDIALTPFSMLRATLSLLPALVLSGCITVGPEHSVPETVGPASFKGATGRDSRSARKSWGAFKDRTLQSLLTDLDDSNLDLRVAYARRNQALRSSVSREPNSFLRFR